MRFEFLQWIEQLGGALLILIILADVFLTVPYARIGAGIISDHLAPLAKRAAFARHRYAD